MANIALSDSMSLGEAGLPPTLPASNLSSKTRVNGKRVVLKNRTAYAPHSGKITHSGLRTVIGGSSKAKIEGYFISRKGDSLQDGDIINQGYSKVNVGG